MLALPFPFSVHSVASTHIPIRNYFTIDALLLSCFNLSFDHYSWCMKTSSTLYIFILFPFWANKTSCLMFTCHWFMLLFNEMNDFLYRQGNENIIQKTFSTRVYVWDHFNKTRFQDKTLRYVRCCDCKAIMYQVIKSMRLSSIRWMKIITIHFDSLQAFWTIIFEYRWVVL